MTRRAETRRSRSGPGPLLSTAFRRAAPAALLVLAMLLGTTTAARPADGGSPRPGWSWPVEPFRLVAPFVAPAHEYGPGHRGVDLEPSSPTAVIRAPADGVVAFAGPVAGRGVLTIDHGDGFVTTLEPLDPLMRAGTPVEGGAAVGSLSTGGHTPPGALHFGVRLHGDYINPLLLFGGVPRAVLLPCCEPLAAAHPSSLRSPSSTAFSPERPTIVLSAPATTTEEIAEVAVTSLRSPATRTASSVSTAATLS